MEEGDSLRREALQSYRRLKVQNAQLEELQVDQDLSGPWNAAKARATKAKADGMNGLLENLDDISAHVEEAQKQYQRTVAIYKGFPEGSHSRDLFETVTSSFARPPSFKGFVFFSDDDIQILKASLASIKSLTFAFSVAFRDLCAIKARATGNVPMTYQFARCFNIPNIVSRTFSQVQGADST